MAPVTTHPAIALEQVSKVYHHRGQSHPVLTDINCTVNHGEILGIIGKSGAGKSTLLRLLNGLVAPTEGRITIAGQDITALSPAALRAMRQKMGFVFQHFNLLESRNVFDNIALPLELKKENKKTIAKKVQDLLTLVHLADQAMQYPSALSGGQKQRVAIARALATDPDILLCDEMTSALDTESTSDIINLIKEINEKLNKTVVLITHELDVIRRLADTTAVIDQGQIVEHSKTAALFLAPTHPASIGLVRQEMAIDLSQYPNAQTLVLLKFSDQDCTAPLITQLIKKFGIDINILQANIHPLKAMHIGYTLCDLSGEPAAVDQAIAHLRTTPIHLEVF
jgi:D-methionine transport system ATP-binding protein